MPQVAAVGLLAIAAAAAAAFGVTPEGTAVQPVHHRAAAPADGLAGGPTAPGAAVPDGTPAPPDGAAPTGPADAGTTTGDASPGSTGAAPDARGGSTPAGTTSGNGNGPRVYDVGVSDTEIKVGASTFTSGPGAVYGEQVAVGLAAGFQYVNERGGVNGRRISLKLYDDGGDPAKQVANAKRLVEVDQVFALASFYAPAVGDYVAAKGIPVIQQGQFDEDFTHPWWFPIGGPQRLSAYSMANFAARQLGVRSVAIFFLNAGAANFSSAYAEDIRKDWEAYGVSVPVIAPFQPDQTSCSDALRQAKGANVDFIVFEIDAGRVVKCGIEANIQGYRPNIGWGGYLIGVPAVYEALGDSAIGMYAADGFEPLYQQADYVDAVRKVSPKTEARSSVTAANFTAALLLADGLAELGDDITRQRLRDVLDTFTGWQPSPIRTGGPLSWTWTPRCHIAMQGGYVIQVQRTAEGLRWNRITEPERSTPLPPGVSPPARYAACDIFRQG